MGLGFEIGMFPVRYKDICTSFIFFGFKHVVSKMKRFIKRYINSHEYFQVLQNIYFLSMSQNLEMYVWDGFMFCRIFNVILLFYL